MQQIVNEIIVYNWTAEVICKTEKFFNKSVAKVYTLWLPYYGCTLF